MGAGKVPSVNVPPPSAPVDQFGQLIAGYQANLRTSAARKGLGSTFLTGAPAPSALSTVYGPMGGTPGTGGV